MVAGLNIQIRHWRITYSDDNEVGGAVVTGSVVGIYQARMSSNPPSQLLLQQGLETERVFNVTRNGTIDFQERDEIEVYRPTDHPYYGDFFRIRGVRYSDFNRRDPRAYMMLTVSRSVSAHAFQ
jgi:hypothetical protein